MYKGYSLTVVMPIHNEQDHLARAIARVPDFVDWIIAIDDGSTDDTWSRLSLIADGRLIKLRHTRNLGVGAATKTGYRQGLETGANLIAVMDGDGQMHPEDLPRLLDRAINGADYVKGNRFLHTESLACMPAARYIGNSIFSWLTGRAAGFGRGLDAQCGYTVIRRQALKRLEIDCLYDRYGFPNEIFFAAQRASLRIECVAVRSIYGDEVSGINPLTAVPTILYLIFRSYLRRRLWWRTPARVARAQEGEGQS